MKRFTLLSLLLIAYLVSLSQWTDDAYENTLVYGTTGEEFIPKVATDNEGNTFISLQSNGSGNYDLFLQYFDNNGEPQWDEALLVSDHSQQFWLSDYTMGVDYGGNAIITFSDTRTGNPDIQAYKISPEGEFLWGEDGINCSLTPESEYEPRLAISENNTAYITFIHPRNSDTDQLVLAAIDEEGNKLFGENGLVFTTDNDEYYFDPYVVSSGEDAIVVYSLNSGYFPYADRILYANKIDGEGNELWDAPALISDASGIAGYTDLNVTSDKAGGVYISWHDGWVPMISSGYVQHISADGEVLLGADGTEVATQIGFHQLNPFVTVNDAENNDICVFWRQANPNQSQFGLFGQKFNNAGERLWSDNGTSIQPVGTTFGMLFGAKAMDAIKTIVIFSKINNGTDEFMYAIALDDMASPVWSDTSTAMSLKPSGIERTELGEFELEQLVVAWEDSRDVNGIYAQNINSDGSIGIYGHQTTYQTGWNMASFAVEPEENNLQTILQTIIDNGELVKVIDEQGNIIEQMPWGWVNNIGAMSPSEGYYIKVTADNSITTTGAPVAIPYDIPLTGGWNMMGYPSMTPQDATGALAELMDNNILIKVIDEQGNIIENMPWGWVNNIGSFQAGEGYYIKVTEDATLTIEEPATRNIQLPESYKAPLASHFTPVYQGNPYEPMQVVIDASLLNLQQGDELAIFSDGKCVGAAGYNPGRTYQYLTASKDDSQSAEQDGYLEGTPVALKVYRKADHTVYHVPYELIEGPAGYEPLQTKIVKATTLTTGIDNVQGQSVILYQNKPNPLKDKTIISYYLPESGDVSLSIVNLHGQEQLKLVDQTQKSGLYQVELDGYRLSPGIYLYQLNYKSDQGNEQQLYKKMTIVR